VAPGCSGHARSRSTAPESVSSRWHRELRDEFTPEPTTFKNGTVLTRRAVYLHFSSRAELVAGLFDHVAEAEGLEDSLRRVWEAPDAAAGLAEWARHLARYHTRLLALDRAVARVAPLDDDAAGHRSRVAAAKLANCRRLIGRLEEEDVLAATWTGQSAADMLFALTSSDVVEGLTVERGWSQRKLADKVGALLAATFLADAQGVAL
jgi:AcrR family transcriptional regulator